MMLNMKGWHIVLVLCAFVILTAVYYNSFELMSDATIVPADDGLWYAVEIEEGKPLFHPHHLLYQLAGSMIWRLQNLWAAGLEVRAAISLQLLSSLAGALGVTLLYFLLLRLTSRPVLSVCCSATLAFSRGYWFYSSSAESIVPGAVLAIPVLYILILLVEGASLRLFFFLGIANAIAYTIRQDNALLFILVLVVSPFLRRGLRLRGLLLYAATFIVIAASVQLLCFCWLNADAFSWKAFYAWSAGYSTMPGWGIVGNLGFEGWKISLLRLLHTIGYGPVQGVALIQTGSLAQWNRILSQANNVIFICFSLCFIFLVVPYARALSLNQRITILFCAVWVVVRETFFTWNLPETVMGFSVGTLIPLTIIVAVMSSNALARSTQHSKVLFILVGLFLTVVLSGLLTVIPFSKETYINNLEQFDTFSRPGDAIIVREFHHYPLLTYYGSRRAAILDYYNEEKFRSLDEVRLRKMIRSTWADGRRVFLMPGGEQGEPFNKRRFEEESKFFDSYHLRPVENEEDKTVSWEVLP